MRRDGVSKEMVIKDAQNAFHTYCMPTLWWYLGGDDKPAVRKQLETIQK